MHARLFVFGNEFALVVLEVGLEAVWRLLGLYNAYGEGEGDERLDCNGQFHAHCFLHPSRFSSAEGNHCLGGNIPIG